MCLVLSGSWCLSLTTFDSFFILNFEHFDCMLYRDSWGSICLILECLFLWLQETLSYNAIGWVLYSFVSSVFCPTPYGLFSLVPWSYIRVLRLCRDAHSLTDLADDECCVLTICPPSWCPFFWTLLSALSTVLFI